MENGIQLGVVPRLAASGDLRRKEAPLRISKTTLRIALFSFSASVFAAQPNQWHQLVLDQSSPEEAIQVLGQPSQDISGAFLPLVKKYHSPSLYTAYRIANSPTAKGLPVRLMLFDRIADGFKNAGLVFRDGKLAMICLGPDKANKILAADIPNEYGVPFRPIFNQRDFETMWTMWDQVGQEARPRQYPPLVRSRRSLLGWPCRSCCIGPERAIFRQAATPWP
jgi:hypothetical protein